MPGRVNESTSLRVYESESRRSGFSTFRWIDISHESMIRWLTRRWVLCSRGFFPGSLLWAYMSVVQRLLDARGDGDVVDVQFLQNAGNGAFGVDTLAVDIVEHGYLADDEFAYLGDRGAIDPLYVDIGNVADEGYVNLFERTLHEDTQLAGYLFASVSVIHDDDSLVDAAKLLLLDGWVAKMETEYVTD